MKLKLDKPLVFFDLETTGTNIIEDRILELYALKYFPDGKTEEYYSRYNPGVHIPAAASAVHGIYYEDVAFEPYFADVVDHVTTFFDGCDLGGYNIIKFDVPFLAEELIRAGVTQPLEGARFVDPMVIFHRKVSRSLAGALKYYRNEELENAHAAKNDVLATIKVLESQLEKHNDLPGTASEMHNYIMDGKELIDFAGCFTKDRSGAVIFAFGKHKGKPISSEPGYLKWMLTNNFSEHTKQIARQHLSKL